MNTASFIYVLNAERFQISTLSTTDILWSAAFTLGATAMIFYKEKKGAYFMAMATIVETIGFVPMYVWLYVMNTAPPVFSFTLYTILTVLPMLVSTILFTIPRKQQL